MSLVWSKVIFSVAILFAGAGGVFLPWVLGRGAPGERFMARGDTFAGGVLAGAGLIHLLNGGVEAFRDLSPNLKYPLAFVLAGFGFMMILLIEGVLVRSQHPGESPLHCRYKATSHEVVPQTYPTSGPSYAFILLLVLSIHSIILGAALGAQGSFARALMIFIAIMTHKAMAGFALGVSYYRSGPSLRRVFPAAVLFSCMAPLGILAGTAANTLIASDGRQLFEAVFDSVGAGTFLYIATLDIIRTEFEVPGDQWQKWGMAAAGFAIMAVLAVWI